MRCGGQAGTGFGCCCCQTAKHLRYDIVALLRHIAEVPLLDEELEDQRQ